MTSNTLLEADFKSLSDLIRSRIQLLANGQSSDIDVSFEDASTYTHEAYGRLLSDIHLTPYERIVLILALSSYIVPEILDPLYLNNQYTSSTFTQLGGHVSTNTSAFLPTGETAIFLCAGHSLTERMHCQQIFSQEGALYRHNLVKLMGTPGNEPPMAGRIIPTDECLHWIMHQSEFKPNNTQDFPAKLLRTQLTWDDLVLDYDTDEGLSELYAWLAHHHEMEQIHAINRKFKKGYKALFYGPPGTGKTLTATLMGQKFGLDVYHIDLSMIVSKYIGETEKNLKNIFDTAENKNWILFFDEADALFGKRTQTNTSNDRYANQEVSYLLQRVEDYPGLVILASNLKSNMDKAFYRRFQSILYFPMPGIEERFRLWKNAFSEYLELDEDINLRELAKSHEVSGAAISNILRYCTLTALSRNNKKVLEEDILTGISRELAKEGKMS